MEWPCRRQSFPAHYRGKKISPLHRLTIFRWHLTNGVAPKRVKAGGMPTCQATPLKCQMFCWEGCSNHCSFLPSLFSVLSTLQSFLSRLHSAYFVQKDAFFYKCCRVRLTHQHNSAVTCVRPTVQLTGDTAIKTAGHQEEALQPWLPVGWDR